MQYQISKVGRVGQILPVPIGILAYKLENRMTYIKQGAQFYPNPEWAKVRLYKIKTGRFPWGLIERVKEELSNWSKIKPEDIFQIMMPKNQDLYNDRFKLLNPNLRDYQKDAILQLVINNGGIICLPTGAGKTFVGIEYIKLIDKPTLIIVNTLDLKQQWIRQVPKNCTVMTYQSIKDYEILKQYGLVIMDECWTGDTYIKTENGPRTISGLVWDFQNNKELPKILSFNTDKKEFEYNKIVNVYKKISEKILQIKVGKKILKCTKEHKLLTNSGYKKASDLKVNDILLGYYDMNENFDILSKELNDDQYQVLLGSYLGDGNIDVCNSNSNSKKYRLREIHGMSQLDYCNWKANMFNVKTVIKTKNGYSKKDAVKFTTKCFELDEKYKIGKKNNIPDWVIEKIDLRGIAIWYMDDGSYNKGNINIATCSFDEESNKKLINKLKNYNIEAKYKLTKKSNGNMYYDIWINKENTIKFISLIEKYIHPNLFYKINKNIDVNDLYKWNNDFLKYGTAKIWGIKEIDNKLIGHCKKQYVYDLEIENNHNYIVCSDRNNSGIISSNCHHSPARGLYNIAMKCHNAILVGLSATPQREDGEDMKIFAALGEIVYKIDRKTLIDQGYLADAKIFYIDHGNHTKDRFLGYPDIYKQYIVDNQERNDSIVEVTKKHYKDKKILILVSIIEHGQYLHDELIRNNIKCRFISGNSREDERLINEDVSVIIATTIFDEGVDLPALDMLVLAAGGKSSIKVTQRIGRVLRNKPGKEAIVYDFVDKSKYLSKHYKRRREILEKDFIVKDV